MKTVAGVQQHQLIALELIGIDTIISNRYCHSAFVAHAIICESLTDKIKFPGTSVQWQNSDLAAQGRVVKKSPWHGRCSHMAAGHPACIHYLRQEVFSPKAAVLCLCLFPYKFKEIKNRSNKSPQNKKAPHESGLAFSVQVELVLVWEQQFLWWESSHLFSVLSSV